MVKMNKIIKRTSRPMTLTECFKAYKLYQRNERKGLIKIHIIGIEQEHYTDASIVEIKSGPNARKVYDNVKHIFFVNYEQIVTK